MTDISLGDTNYIIAACKENNNNFKRLLKKAKECDDRIQSKRVVITRKEPVSDHDFVLYLYGPGGAQLLKLQEFNGDELELIFDTIDKRKKQVGGKATYRHKYLKYKAKYLNLQRMT